MKNIQNNNKTMITTTMTYHDIINYDIIMTSEAKDTISTIGLFPQ